MLVKFHRHPRHFTPGDGPRDADDRMLRIRQFIDLVQREYEADLYVRPDRKRVRYSKKALPRP
jgi:hypothetical protein